VTDRSWNIDYDLSAVVLVMSISPRILVTRSGSTGRSELEFLNSRAN